MKTVLSTMVVCALTVAVGNAQGDAKKPAGDEGAPRVEETKKGVAAEANVKLPFKGDEVPLVRVKADPTQYVGKQFVICGVIKLMHYYNYGYRDAELTHYAFEFRQVDQDTHPAPGRPEHVQVRLLPDNANLYLSRKTGEPIAKLLVAAQEKSPTTTYSIVRATVTILPGRYEPVAWNMFELLDVQRITEDKRDWQVGILAQIELMEKKKLEETLAAQSEELAARRAAAEAAQKRIEDAKRRIWTSASGAHQTTAKFVTMAGGVVTLEKDDGTRIEVPLEQLSKEDQNFIRNREWLKQSPPPEKKD